MLTCRSVMAVRWMLDVYRLEYLIRPDRVDVEGVRALFRDGDPLSEQRERCLQRLLADEIEAPTLANPDMPYSVHYLLASLIQASLPPV